MWPYEPSFPPVLQLRLFLKKSLSGVFGQKSAHTLLTLRLVLFSCLAMLAGCIAIVPITEYVQTTTGGVVHTSNCLGAKSVRYNIDGVPVWISLDRGIGDPLQLLISDDVFGNNQRYTGAV
jgi:hypothetical protein